MRALHVLITTAAFISSFSNGFASANPKDPLEAFNRKTFQFNQGFDKIVLKPMATAYHSLIPAPIRTGIDNVYNNVNLIPTVANDILQAEWNSAIKDTWRFIVNSSLGVGGILDVASSCSLPAHSNDLGITFAKWGDTRSPYIVLPFLGPSTIRDGVGLMFNYTLFTPYPYLNTALELSVDGLRYVDLRSQMTDTDRIINEALDPYTFVRDAYLQHRDYLITGLQKTEESGSGYVEDDATDEPQTPSEFPLTTAQHASHRTASA